MSTVRWYYIFIFLSSVPTILHAMQQPQKTPQEVALESFKQALQKIRKDQQQNVYGNIGDLLCRCKIGINIEQALKDKTPLQLLKDAHRLRPEGEEYQIDGWLYLKLESVAKTSKDLDDFSKAIKQCKEYVTQPESSDQ
jgi:hypothetical protein